MNDMQFPCLILIPRVPGITELYEFSQADQNSSYVNQAGYRANWHAYSVQTK